MGLARDEHKVPQPAPIRDPRAESAGVDQGARSRPRRLGAPLREQPQLPRRTGAGRLQVSTWPHGAVRHDSLARWCVELEGESRHKAPPLPLPDVADELEVGAGRVRLVLCRRFTHSAAMRLPSAPDT